LLGKCEKLRRKRTPKTKRNRKRNATKAKEKGTDLEAGALACTSLLLHRCNLKNLVFDRFLKAGEGGTDKGTKKI
jgi:hypothetical protein